MKIITAPIMKQLRKNSQLTMNDRGSNNKPVLKLFGGSNCTWLISEIDDDGDTLFGLCDLGMRTPELGYVSLSELLGIRFSFGLPIERDRSFSAKMNLSEYTEIAQSVGFIKT